MAAGGAADPLRPGEVMLDYYGHGAVLVTAPGGERVMFDRWSGRADADGTPLLHDFPAVTADHSLSTAAAPASWEGARIRVTGSGAGEGSLYLVEAGGMRIVIWGRAPAGSSVPAAALARYGRPDVMVLPADMMEEVSARLRPAIVVPVRYRIDPADRRGSATATGRGGVCRQALPHKAGEAAAHPHAGMDGRLRAPHPVLRQPLCEIAGCETALSGRAVPRLGIGCQMACKPGSVPVSR